MPFIAVVVAIVLLGMAVEKIGWIGVVVAAIFLLVVLGTLMDHMSRAQQRKLDEIKYYINGVLERHAELVDRTALHTFKKSHMGVISPDRFNKEIIEFLQVHAGYDVHSKLAELGTNLSAFYLEYIADVLAQNTLIRIESGRHITGPVENMTPVEYEIACADLFKKNGWTVEMTSATGDQGVDIIINKGSKTGVVQCKRYTKPVGNGAVQEVAAGRSHYRASIAIVVSPSGFTKSAKQLAESTGVHLLHHEEIRRFSA